MAQPRFSIVVPTCNRAETLRYCLQTCLCQDFDDYEVVVCDNFSTSETREVVEQTRSPKIKYVRTPKPLAMSDNWNFALSHASGEFVTILGDDDGMMPYGLREIDRLASQTQLKAICWDAGLYTWPSIPLPQEANYLTFKLTRVARTIDGKAAIASVLRHEMGVQYLPMVYHAAVHQSITSQIRQTAGTVFPAVSPDASAGIGIAYASGTYLFLDVPMSLSGLGPKSTNIASMSAHRGTLLKEFWNQQVPDGRALHPWVPDLSSDTSVIMEAFLRAKEGVFPYDSSLALDRQLCAKLALSSAHEQERPGAIQKIRASLADVPELQTWFDLIAPQIPVRPPNRYTYAPPFRGCNGDAVYLSADRFGIRDIAGAVAFCANFLSYKGGQINYDLPARGPTNAALQQAQQQLAAAQNRIRELESRV